MPDDVLIDKKNYTFDKYSLVTSNSIKHNFESMYHINHFLGITDINPREISQKIGSIETTIYLDTGIILVNGEPVDLEISKILLAELTELGLRWVNFNRNRVDYASSLSLPIKMVTYVIGWQGTTMNGDNIQRFVAVKPNGSWKLWKKK